MESFGGGALKKKIFLLPTEFTPSVKTPPSGYKNALSPLGAEDKNVRG